MAMWFAIILWFIYLALFILNQLYYYSCDVLWGSTVQISFMQNFSIWKLDLYVANLYLTTWVKVFTKQSREIKRKIWLKMLQLTNARNICLTYNSDQR